MSPFAESLRGGRRTQKVSWQAQRAAPPPPKHSAKRQKKG